MAGGAFSDVFRDDRIDDAVAGSDCVIRVRGGGVLLVHRRCDTTLRPSRGGALAQRHRRQDGHAARRERERSVKPGQTGTDD